MKWSLPVLSLLLFFSCTQDNAEKHVLPFIGNYDIEYKLVDGKEVTDTVYPTIPYFYFRDHDSNLVRSTDLKGKIWVTDFFFTTCPTICPAMTRNMMKLNENLSDLSEHIQFMSISINPDHDQPSVLKRYR